MRTRIMKRAYDRIIMLLDAEQACNAEAVQKAYEELFHFCRENNLNLPALLHEPEGHQHLKAA